MADMFGSRDGLIFDAFSQRNPIRSDLETRRTSADMSAVKSRSNRSNEKELMRGLNDRLSGFIERVRQLEHHNHLLETEIEEQRGKVKSASSLEEEHGPEFRRLRQLVQDITHQKCQIEIQHRNLEEELSALKRRHDRETDSRSEAESDIMIVKKDISDAYLAKILLDRKAESLVDEINLLKRNHEADVSEMHGRIQDAHLQSEAHGFGHVGVTAALRDVRMQLDGGAVSDVRQVGESFRAQFVRLTEAAEAKREALKESRQQIQEYKSRLQAKSVELDCATGTSEALERQLREVEDRHKEELVHYQNTIKELENELINFKFDMSSYLREYQDLLNVKMALDVEILSYRKLLCGEEARLSFVSGPDPQIPFPHIYHQSPVYSLPSFSRPGVTHRRAEPKYKFVEEIITETTREIEMSEFEETGSEETDVGRDEQECGKSAKEGSEEEGDHKNSGEDEANQVSDSQQSEVASDEKLEDNGDDTNIAEEVEVKGQNQRQESLKTQALLSGENMHTEVHHGNEAKHIKEKETAEVPHQTDSFSKLLNLQVEVTGESEERINETETAKEENVHSVQTVNRADDTVATESGDYNKLLKHSTVIQVQDKANKLKEATTTTVKDTGECVKILKETSTDPKNESTKIEEKVQKEINKTDAGKAEEEDTKSTKDSPQ